MSDPTRFTVLVVDDSEAEISILVETLADDYDVSVAMDGVSALEYLAETIPDLILLDILMPDMDGYEVIMRIMADERTRDIPVMFCTSMTDAIDETRGLALGAVDYITKPFMASVIQARVKTHLELAQARKDLQRQNEILNENIDLREQVELISRHDLKNPLQAIMMASQLLLQDKKLDETTRDKLIRNQIISCQTMLNMINRSLDLFKMEQGTYTVEAKCIDALPVLDQVLLGVDRLSGLMALELKIRVKGRPRRSDSVFMVYCDELILFSMLSNLIKNAVEASPHGGTVEISLEENGETMINIRNRGAVPFQIRGRFFEKYATFGKEHGTGLGTYSAGKMAEIHGGRINLSVSDEEDRTTVQVVLPKATMH